MNHSIPNTRCIFCGSTGLVEEAELTRCQSCQHEYPKFNDVVFLGSYQQADVLGLMEVTSKISTNIDPVAMRANREKSERELKVAFEKYYSNGRQPGANDALGSQQMAMNVRLREWGAFELLASQIDFAGKLCLDNGAGLGSDSQRLIDRGGEVVCLDFNPISVENGMKVVPEAKWVCGNSEYLPFSDNTFDISMANAALHHMHDLRSSIREMIRVTKPGGYVLLISDPFMESVETKTDKEAVELKVFDKHPMVLGGVNESFVPINLYCNELAGQQDVVLLTMKIHNDSEHGDVAKFWELNQQTQEYLGAKRGNLSSRFQVNKDQLDPQLKDIDEIPTSPFFETIGNPRLSVNFLLPYLPDLVFDSFPFQSQLKFNLLNGWRSDQNYESEWREGYLRSRLFFKKSGLQDMAFEIRRAQEKQGQTDVYWSLNGTRQDVLSLTNGTAAQIQLPDNVVLNERNVIEVGIAGDLENKGAIWGQFDPAKSFEVRCLRRENVATGYLAMTG